jgi:hypothetical protein
MKDKFNHIERRGLPGGPNEQFTYVTGVFSTDGYRYDSPDVNNIHNVIPSGNISMREKNGEPLKKGPILGIDNLGNRELMQPGFDYQFPGDQVFELPMAQIGKETKKNTPIYVDDKNDPRFKAYNDSLNNYQYGEDWKNALSFDYIKTKQKPYIDNSLINTFYKETDKELLQKPNKVVVYPSIVTKNGKKQQEIRPEYDSPIQPIIYKEPIPKQVLGNINVQGKNIPYHSKEEKEQYFKLFQDNGIKVEGNNGNYGVSRNNELTSGWNGNKLYLKGNKELLDLDKKALGGLLMAQKGKYIPPNFSDFNYGQTASESTSRTYNSRELKKPVSTATLSVSKQQVAKSVQEAQRLRKIQEDERRARIADAEAAKKIPYTLQNFPEVIARETQAIGDKLQSDYIPDAINPGVWFGDFASGIGRVPLNLQQGNYGEAALSIGLPLAIGAFAGLGAKTTGQFVNNLVNPLAGTGQFLTTQTPLKNAYKINPWAFKPNPEAYYRGIGRTGLDDALESRLIRTPEGSFYNDMYMSPDINIAKDYSRNKPTWTWQEVESTIPGKPSEIKQVFSPVDRTSYIAEIPKSSLSDVRNINELVSTTRNQIPLDQARLLKEDWLRGYKQVNTPTQLPGSPNIQQAGFFDTKGALQKYPKGKLTQEEIEAYKNSDYYKQNTKDHLDAKNKYGDSWTLPNYAEENLLEAFVTGNRSKINPILYGGRNWRTSDYVTAGLVGTAFPGVLGLHSLVWAPPAIRSKALKSLGIQGVPGGLSSQDTTIDITNRPMSFAKVNQTTDGDIIIGGEFIEDVNNTVRKAKDWLVASDTYSDKKYSSKDIQSFYGIEDGKFKVGKADEFNAETEIVPRRFGAINIDKATLNGEEMRLLDKQGNPIYQNTPNTGKFILYSPSTGKAEFTYINTGKSGVNKVNNFLKKNKDAQYIHLDNGRYEYYGINPEGLTEQDFKNYYEQDFKRKGNPGYNMVIKQYGGDINQPKYQTGNEIAFDIYKKYINGDYIGTLEEGKAKKTYDRLNRIYYKDAKSSGMSVPNYIMTNVVTL